jgi:hypothetical protein
MVNPDFDALLDALLLFAKRQLAEHGTFVPFAASIDQRGDMNSNAVYVGEEAKPQELYVALTEAMSALAESGDTRAIGICADVLHAKSGAVRPTDAIRIQFAHMDGTSMDIYVPYRKRTLRGLTFDESYSEFGTLRIFP